MRFPAFHARPWRDALSLAAAPQSWRAPLVAHVDRLHARFAEAGLFASIVFEREWVTHYALEVAAASGGKAWSPLAHADQPCAALLVHDSACKIFAVIAARLLWIEGTLADAMRRWPEAPAIGPDLAADIADRHVVWLGALWRDPTLRGRGLGGALTEAMALDALLRWRFGHIVGVRRDQGLMALDMAPFRRAESPLRTRDGADYALVAACRAQLRDLAGVTA
jgi:hypothetical protein